MSDANRPLPTISFVIPVRSDAGRLDQCLRSIRANQYPPELITIVVADNGSTDDSQSVALRHGARVLSLPTLRLGALRNAAAGAADGDVIAFVDADHEIDGLWAAAVADLMNDPQVGGVGAPCVPPEPGTWVQQFYDRLRSHPIATQAVDWLGSGNLAVRRDVFSAVSGFDTSLETCEDVDLCRRLRARGVMLLADGRLRSVHHGDPRTLRQLFLGELWRGRDNIRVSLRPPRSWRMLVSAMVPAANLGGLVATALGLTGLFGRTWTVTGSAGGLVLAMLGVRTVVMLRRQGFNQLSDFPRAFLVAAAYELGRALAVLGRFGYDRRRASAVTKAPVSRAGGGLAE